MDKIEQLIVTIYEKISPYTDTIVFKGLIVVAIILAILSFIKKIWKLGLFLLIAALVFGGTDAFLSINYKNIIEKLEEVKDVIQEEGTNLIKNL